MSKQRSPFAAVAAVLLAGLSAGGARADAVRTAVSYKPAPVTHAEVAIPATAGEVPVGTVVRAVPADCTSLLVANVAYQRCGNTWYRPSYSGSTVTYTVVTPPTQ
jgi:hypothetical protein